MTINSELSGNLAKVCTQSNCFVCIMMYIFSLTTLVFLSHTTFGGSSMRNYYKYNAMHGLLFSCIYLAVHTSCSSFLGCSKCTPTSPGLHTLSSFPGLHYAGFIPMPLSCSSLITSVIKECECVPLGILSQCIYYQNIFSGFLLSSDSN